MAISTNRAMHVTAPVTVGTAAALVTATSTLGANDAGRLFYDTDEAIAGGIGWQVWNGDALVTDYTYVTQATLLSGEDQDNDVLVVEQGRFPAVSVARTTSAASIGATGAAGDYLQRVVVTVAPVTAALTISDGAGTVVCSIPTTATIGTVVEVGCIASTSGFVVNLHATGAGTVTCIGRFTA